MGYNPTVGRWIQRDPAQDGPNLYENVKSNPVNLTDPLGLVATPVWNMGKEFDLVIVTATDMKDEDKESFRGAAWQRAEILNKQPTVPRTQVPDVLVFVTSCDEFVQAVTRRYEQLNPPGASEKKCLSLLIIGHGTSGVGPYIGPGLEATPDQKKAGRLLPYVPNDPGGVFTKPESVRQNLPSMPLGKVKGMVKQVTFSNCGIAGTPAAKSILDVTAKELGVRMLAPTVPGWTRATEDGDYEFEPVPPAGEAPQPYNNYIYDTQSHGPMQVAPLGKQELGGQ